MLCATLGDVRTCRSSKNCCDANTVGHADDTSNRMWINYISNEWVARDTSHVAFSKPRAGTECGRDVQPQRLPMRFGTNRGKRHENPSESTTLVCSALLTSSIERSKTALCKKAQCACDWPREEENTITDLQFPDRRICSRCPWREITASGYERCDTT